MAEGGDVFEKGSENGIVNKSFSLAVRVVRLCRFLRETKQEFVLTKQLLRSGTSGKCRRSCRRHFPGRFLGENQHCLQGGEGNQILAQAAAGH